MHVFRRRVVAVDALLVEFARPAVQLREAFEHLHILRVLHRRGVQGIDANTGGASYGGADILRLAGPAARHHRRDLLRGTGELPRDVVGLTAPAPRLLARSLVEVVRGDLELALHRSGQIPHPRRRRGEGTLRVLERALRVEAGPGLLLDRYLEDRVE